MEDANSSGSTIPATVTTTTTTMTKSTTSTATTTMPTTIITQTTELKTPTTKTITTRTQESSATDITSQNNSEHTSSEGSSSVNSSFSKTDNHPEIPEMAECKNKTIRYGKCKWFNVAKGWGFITPNDGGQEVFVHQSVIKMSGFRSLGEQEEVEFEAKETERGLEATRVSGYNGMECHGSTFRPHGNLNRNTTSKKKRRRIRCYNCGEFSNHIAAKCELGPQSKRCHFCKQTDHLYADCPTKKVQAS